MISWSFLPISILAYALNGGSIIIDKILLKSSLPNPFVYTFYISVLGTLVLIFIPFGVLLNERAMIFSVLSGILGIFAFLSFFQGLKIGEASVVGPVVGGLNPLFTLIIGAFILNQLITHLQLLAFFVLLLGAGILTLNIWASKLKANEQLFMIALSALMFATSSIFLKEAFLSSNFVTGLIISRMAAAVFVLLFLIPQSLRSQIFTSKLTAHNFINKTTLLMFSGQTMGALFWLLWAFAISLTSPALVNSLFGVQYLVILAVALLLSKKHPQLLDENLTKGMLLQKMVGAGILSWGVYLLSK